MIPLVLFDLGDCLLYREKSHQDFDLNLMQQLFDINHSEAITAIESVVGHYIGLYSFWRFRVNDLNEEDKYNENAFREIFHKLGLSENELKTFLTNRLGQNRYMLFPDVIKMLEIILNNNYELGVVTNGRPSRKRELTKLGLLNYFRKDRIFVSDEIGYAKPNPIFFKYINDQIRQTEVFLFDDEKINIIEAKRNEWKGAIVDHKSAGFDVVYKLLNLK